MVDLELAIEVKEVTVAVRKRWGSPNPTGMTDLVEPLRHTHEDDMIASLAGAAAEARLYQVTGWPSHLLKEGCGTDIANAKKSMRKASITLAEAQNLAEQYVDALWDDINTVALALAKHRKLTGRQIERLLGLAPTADRRRGRRRSAPANRHLAALRRTG